VPYQLTLDIALSSFFLLLFGPAVGKIEWAALLSFWRADERLPTRQGLNSNPIVHHGVRSMSYRTRGQTPGMVLFARTLWFDAVFHRVVLVDGCGLDKIYTTRFARIDQTRAWNRAPLCLRHRLFESKMPCHEALWADAAALFAQDKGHGFSELSSVQPRCLIKQ
jgi:hypothetical protein